MYRFVGGQELDKIYTDAFAFNLGQRVQDEQSREFIFCKNNDGDGNGAATAGFVGVGLDSAYPAYEVTWDVNSATVPALRNLPYGFGQAAFTDGTYGFWQYKGLNRKVILTDGDVTQGQVLFPHATTTGGVDSGAGPANATNTSVGVALEADSGTELAIGSVFININI